MNEPIKAGDKARIVRGLAQGKSPNVGLEVKVGMTIPGAHGMPHSQFGRIVEVFSADVCQMNDAGAFVKLGWAHIPVAWLEKIEPDAPPPTATTTDREITA